MALTRYRAAKNGRTVYKHVEQDLYLYYNDWGNLLVILFKKYCCFLLLPFAG